MSHGLVGARRRAVRAGLLFTALSVAVGGRLAVAASFNPLGPEYLLSVTTTTDDGAPGRVTSAPPGILCGDGQFECQASFAAGTMVTLTAAASPGFGLLAWGGDCAGTGDCQFTIDGPKTVSAAFASAAFVELPPLGGVVAGRAAWGDYDNDGDLDLVVVGDPANYVKTATIYQNVGGPNDRGTLVESGIAIVQESSFAVWGDYDGDGDLDLVVGGSPVTQLYRNDGNAFVPVVTPFRPVADGPHGSNAAWGDYDNDGDLDLAIVGVPSILYRNDGGTFVETDLLPNAYCFDLAWGDYDRDGNLDLAVLGEVSKLYRNTGGLLVDSGMLLPGAIAGSVAWADYDSDGDLDLAVLGVFDSQDFTRIYRNDAGTLTDSGVVLPRVSGGRARWGDYLGTGDPDLLITGYSSQGPRTKLFLNDSGTFTDAVPTGLRDLSGSEAAWGDADGDGRLDVLLLGADRAGALHTGVYLNIGGQPGTPPFLPTAPTAEVTGRAVRFSWQGTYDYETPSEALTYNVRVGRTPGGSEIAPAMADPATGNRLLPQPGNAGQSTSKLLRGLSHGRYYWSVQAIDSGWAGSAFVDGGSFVVNQAPVAVASGPVGGTSGVPIAFTGAASSDPDGDVLTYAWTFGDGGTSTGATPSHAYAAPGTYTVSLVVNDGFVDSPAATLRVVVATAGALSCPTVVAPRVPFAVTVGTGNSVHDVLGLYASGAPFRSYLAYRFVPLPRPQTVTFTAPSKVGHYEVRFFARGAHPQFASCAIDVGAGPVTVSTP